MGIGQKLALYAPALFLALLCCFELFVEGCCPFCELILVVIDALNVSLLAGFKNCRFHVSRRCCCCLMFQRYRNISKSNNPKLHFYKNV